MSGIVMPAFISNRVVASLYRTILAPFGCTTQFLHMLSVIKYHPV